MRAVDNKRGVLSTLPAAIAALCAHAAVLGRPGPDPAPPEPPPAELAAALLEAQRAVPTPLEAMAAFRAVDAWVRKLEVPEGADRAEGILPVAGASVTIRLGGVALGRGSAFTLETGGSRTVIADAAREAIAEAERRLPGDRDATWAQKRPALAQTLTVGLELAGNVTPIDLRTWAGALRSIEPGVQGLAVRGAGAEGRVEAMFPWAMLASQTEPPTAARALAGRVLGDASASLGKEPAELAEDPGLAFYRFDAVHLAQALAGDTPGFYHRGAVLLRPAALDLAELRRWAGLMGEHLVRTPPEGDAVARALVVHGLGAYEAVVPAERRRAVRTLRATRAGELLTLAGDAAPWNDPATAALVVVAVDRALAERAREAGAAPALDGWDRCLAAARGAFDPAKGFAEGLRPAARGLVALALVRGAMGDEPAWPAATAAVRRTFAQTTPEGLLGLLPAIWEADRTLSERGPGAVGAQGDLVGAEPLRIVRARLWDAMLTPEALEPNRIDLAGGIRLGGDAGGLPTWRGAGPVAFAAGALRSAELTPAGERPRETARVLAALRHLRRLTVDEPAAALRADGASALGGVRGSAWDQRVTPEATSMTLVAAVEALRALDPGLSRGPAEGRRDP